MDDFLTDLLHARGLPQCKTVQRDDATVPPYMLSATVQSFSRRRRDRLNMAFSPNHATTTTIADSIASHVNDHQTARWSQNEPDYSPTHVRNIPESEINSLLLAPSLSEGLVLHPRLDKTTEFFSMSDSALNVQAMRKPMRRPSIDSGMRTNSTWNDLAPRTSQSSMMRAQLNCDATGFNSSGKSLTRARHCQQLLQEPHKEISNENGQCKASSSIGSSSDLLASPSNRPYSTRRRMAIVPVLPSPNSAESPPTKCGLSIQSHHVSCPIENRIDVLVNSLRDGEIPLSPMKRSPRNKFMNSKSLHEKPMLPTLAPRIDEFEPKKLSDCSH